jgi:hypothetical protein
VNLPQCAGAHDLGAAGQPLVDVSDCEISEPTAAEEGNDLPLGEMSVRDSSGLPRCPEPVVESIPGANKAHMEAEPDPASSMSWQTDVKHVLDQDNTGRPRVLSQDMGDGAASGDGNGSEPALSWTP